MSIYNKNTKTTEKINRNLTLAQIIEQAGTQPEYRAIFYERMLKDYIYVLVQSGYKPEDLTVGIDPNIPVITFENGGIPVFTHPDRIYDGGAINEEMDYIKVRGRSFLELTIGHPLIVNPFSKIYKELVPPEVSEMLNGSIFNPKHSPILRTKMNALIGHPEYEPTQLLNALSNTYAEVSEITNAYLGWTFTEEVDNEAHYTIAIETETEKPFKEFAVLTSTVCQDHLNGDQVIDIVKLEPGGNFSDFFYNQSTPFYTRK